jgi:hypothetical protein
MRNIPVAEHFIRERNDDCFQKRVDHGRTQGNKPPKKTQGQQDGISDGEAGKKEINKQKENE